jgi:hopene-associated glycosyltransferase HpnB
MKVPQMKVPQMKVTQIEDHQPWIPAGRTITEMLIAAGVLSLLIWVYLVLARGSFWRIYPAAPASDAKASPVHIAVIIPARDEADVVSRAVRSLLQQTGPHRIHIFLVDDASTDGTAQAARAAATAAGQAQNLTVVSGSPLPHGWSGKLWAMQQGIEQAGNTACDFFLFTDADIEHAPDSVATLVSIAHAGAYDMASFMVKLHCQSVAEKLLIPAFVYFFFKLYPPAWIANSRRSEAGAAGGCILIRPDVLEKAGGIQAIRQEVIDDCALAARVKRNGGRLWLGASATTHSIRPYDGFSGIGRMISRSAFNQLRHSNILLLLSMAGMAATYLLPLVLLVAGHRIVPAALGGAACLLMVLSYLPVLRLYRLNPLWALALPVAAVFYMGATLHSAWKYWMGKGGEWKGRIQDPRESPQS